MQLQRRLEASLREHKRYVSNQTEAHEESGHTPPQDKVPKSTASSCRTSNADMHELRSPPDAHATRTQAASTLHADDYKGCEGERVSVDGKRPLANDMQAEDSTLPVESRTEPGFATAAPAGDGFAEDKSVQREVRQSFAYDHSTDPLMSLHNLGGDGSPDGFDMGLLDEHGGNGINDYSMPTAMPDWGDAEVEVGEFDGEEIFALPDATVNLSESGFPDPEHQR